MPEIPRSHLWAPKGDLCFRIFWWYFGRFDYRPKYLLDPASIASILLVEAQWHFSHACAPLASNGWSVGAQSWSWRAWVTWIYRQSCKDLKTVICEIRVNKLWTLEETKKSNSSASTGFWMLSHEAFIFNLICVFFPDSWPTSNLNDLGAISAPYWGGFVSVIQTPCRRFPSTIDLDTSVLHFLGFRDTLNFLMRFPRTVLDVHNLASPGWALQAPAELLATSGHPSSLSQPVLTDSVM